MRRRRRRADTRAAPPQPPPTRIPERTTRHSPRGTNRLPQRDPIRHRSRLLRALGDDAVGADEDADDGTDFTTRTMVRTMPMAKKTARGSLRCVLPIVGAWQSTHRSSLIVARTHRPNSLHESGSDNSRVFWKTTTRDYQLSHAAAGATPLGGQSPGSSSVLCVRQRSVRFLCP